jgi:hypothetical protein
MTKKVLSYLPKRILILRVSILRKIDLFIYYLCNVICDAFWQSPEKIYRVYLLG